MKFYSDQPFEGARLVKGRFDSANPSGLTLYLENGESRTLPMRAVRKVQARRPFAKRIPGWAAVALAAGIAEILLYASSEGIPHSAANRLRAHAITTLPAMGAFFLWPNNTVYNVPPGIESHDAACDTIREPSLGWRREVRATLGRRRSPQRASEGSGRNASRGSQGRINMSVAEAQVYL